MLSVRRTGAADDVNDSADTSLTFNYLIVRGPRQGQCCALIQCLPVRYLDDPGRCVVRYPDGTCDRRRRSDLIKLNRAI